MHSRTFTSAPGKDLIFFPISNIKALSKFAYVDLIKPDKINLDVFWLNSDAEKRKTQLASQRRTRLAKRSEDPKRKRVEDAQLKRLPFIQKSAPGHGTSILLIEKKIIRFFRNNHYTPSVMWVTVGTVLSMLDIGNSLPTRGRSMKKQILIVTAAALTAAVVILDGTSAATAQQTPQYQVGGFPITPHQMSVLQPSAKINEQQRLSRQRTMDAS